MTVVMTMMMAMMMRMIYSESCLLVVTVLSVDVIMVQIKVVMTFQTIIVVKKKGLLVRLILKTLI